MGALALAASLFPVGVCIATAVGTAAYAARRAQSVDVLLGLEEGDEPGGGAGTDGGSADGSRSLAVGAPLSAAAAIAFPFVASAALLFLFFFYAGVSALLAVLVTVSSAMALAFLVYPPLEGLAGRLSGGGVGAVGGWARLLPAGPAAGVAPRGGGSPSAAALLGADGVAAGATGAAAPLPPAGGSRRRGSGGSVSGRAPAAADGPVPSASARWCGGTVAVPPPPVVATGVVVAATLGGWLMTGHWALNNLLGISQCVLFVSLVRVHAAVTSLRVCTALLAGLFVYDVFWVFASARLFGTNVMVAVATQDATNPVASAATALHLPVVPVARLALPVKLVFPTGDGGGLMLGLGDIFVPGLLLGLVLAFDATTAAAAATAATAAASRPLTAGGGGPRRRGCLPADGIFPLALVGYAAGLAASFVANGVFGVAQPALLYIVPSTIGPVVAATASRGDLGDLWRGPVVYGCGLGGQGGLPAPATTAGDGGVVAC